MLVVGSAAQIVAALCLNEWTLDPQSAARPIYAADSRTMAFTPQCSLAMTHYL